ncbi:MAG: hypothetical protein VKJ05_01110 [Synechococcaceae cyanobacterium]|nr:hypothetical protein [Synechococcaceae cyanobacterium]
MTSLPSAAGSRQALSFEALARISAGVLPQLNERAARQFREGHPPRPIPGLVREKLTLPDPFQRLRELFQH